MDADARRYIDRRIRLLTKRLDKHGDAIQQIADYLTLHPVQRHIAQALTDVPNGASTIAVTIDPPMTSTYGVSITPIAGQALVGKLLASVAPLSKTATGFTVALSNTTGAIITSAGLDITITPD
jgi:hypothetical protein